MRALAVGLLMASLAGCGSESVKPSAEYEVPAAMARAMARRSGQRRRGLGVAGGGMGD